MIRPMVQVNDGKPSMRKRKGWSHIKTTRVGSSMGKRLNATSDVTLGHRLVSDPSDESENRTQSSVLLPGAGCLIPAADVTLACLDGSTCHNTTLPCAEVVLNEARGILIAIRSTVA